MIFDIKNVFTQLNISDLNIKSRKLCLLQEKIFMVFGNKNKEAFSV